MFPKLGLTTWPRKAYPTRNQVYAKGLHPLCATLIFWRIRETCGCSVCDESTPLNLACRSQSLRRSLPTNFRFLQTARRYSIIKPIKLLRALQASSALPSFHSPRVCVAFAFRLVSTATSSDYQRLPGLCKRQAAFPARRNLIETRKSQICSDLAGEKNPFRFAGDNTSGGCPVFSTV